MIELREERSGSPASRALFDEYMDLIRVRSGIEDFVAVERIFATEDAFAADDAAWMVVYIDGAPVACGGLRTLAPGIGEIKRMFVTDGARGRGVGRYLLHELEARALAVGHSRVRLLTTPMLSEACVLYAAEGYVEISRWPHGEGPVEIWLEKALG